MSVRAAKLYSSPIPDVKTNFNRVSKRSSKRNKQTNKKLFLQLGHPHTHTHTTPFSHPLNPSQLSKTNSLKTRSPNGPYPRKLHRLKEPTVFIRYQAKNIASARRIPALTGDAQGSLSPLFHCVQLELVPTHVCHTAPVDVGHSSAETLSLDGSVRYRRWSIDQQIYRESIQEKQDDRATMLDQA